MRMQRKIRRAWQREQNLNRFKPPVAAAPSAGRTPIIRNTLVRTLVPSAIAASLVFSTITPAFAQDISANGKTQTNITVNGNTTDITTSTINGQNAYNSFNYFTLDQGNTANFLMPGGTSNLLNVVTHAVSIDGVVNLVQNGNIGGNMFFITPGFVVGKTGVLNVGSLNVVTPTQDFINNFFVSGAPSETATVQVLTGQVPLDSNGFITVQGTINAVSDIHLTGGNISNSGTMSTGAVFVTARPDMGSFVNLNGMQSGTKIKTVNGSIEIVAANDFENSGKISTDGASRLNAGNITITAGNNILLESGSVISAQGMGSYSSGGTISLLAGNNATFTNATINAGGGGLSGDGGSIHFSGKNEVTIQGGSMTAGAKNGRAGEVLIDPATINWTGSDHDVFQTDGTKYTLIADKSITLTDVVISTRQVETGKANRTDITTAASTGNSGDITITAPNIVLGSGTKILANADHGYTGGKVTLEAKDAAAVNYAGYKTASASIQIGDNNGGATIMGDSIDIHAVAIADNGFIIPDTDDATKNTISVATTELTTAPSQLAAFYGINVLYSQADATATITVKNGSELKADQSVDIHAETTTSAGSRPLEIPGFPIYTKVDTPLALGVIYAAVNADATVTVENSASIAAKDLSVTAHNDASVDASIKASPNVPIGTSTVSLALGVTYADVTATATVGGTLNVSGDLQVAAINEGSYANEVKSTTGADGVAAGAVAISLRDSSATANLTASVPDATNVGVIAINNIDKDETKASTKTGTTTTTDIINQLETNVSNSILKPVFGFLKLDSLNPNPASQTPTEQKLRVAGAIAYADNTDNAVATIGGGTQIHATGSVAVGSLIDAKNTNISATSAAVSNAADDPTAGNTSKQSYSVGLTLGTFNHNASATIGSNVTVTAAEIGVSSAVDTPIRDHDFFENPFGEWSSVGTFLDKVDSLAQTGEGIVGLASLFNGSTAAKATSDETKGSINLSGSVSILDFNNTSQAVVDSGATLNLTGTQKGSWTSESVALSPGKEAKTITVGGTTYTYKSAKDPITVSFNFDRQAQVRATNDSTLIFLGGPVIPSSSGEVGLGVSVDDVTVNSSAMAFVREGAKIQGATETETNNSQTQGYRTWTVVGGQYASELQVTSENNDNIISLVASSGYGASYGLTGTVAVTNLNQKSYAWVDDEASIKTDYLGVKATSSPVVFSIGGEASLSSAASVGVGIAINQVTGDTRAEIADNDTITIDGSGRTSQLTIAGYNPETDTGALIAAPVVDVEAHTGGNVGAFAVTGSIENSNMDDTKPGLIDRLKGGYKKVLQKAANAVKLTQGKVTKDGESLEKPGKPSFGLAGAGSGAVNTTNLENSAIVDHVYINQSKPADITGNSSLVVRGTTNTLIIAASGAAAITRAKTSTQKVKAGVTGSVAVNMIGNGNSAILSNSTVTNSDILAIQALSTGDQVAVAIGVNADVSSQGNDITFSANGSVSLTLDQTDDAGKSKNFTNTLVKNSNVTGVSGDSNRRADVIAYDSTTIGTGGGSLELQLGESKGIGAGVGATITYADLHRDVSSTVSNSTINNLDEINVRALSAGIIGAGGGMVSITKNPKSIEADGTVLISLIDKNTTAVVDSNSNLTATKSVTVNARNTGTDKTLEGLIDTTSKEKNLDYNALDVMPDGSDGIIAVAGIVQVGKGPNVGVSINYSEITDDVSAQVWDSKLTATGANGSVDVKADSDSRIYDFTVGVGVSTNNLSGGGSIGIAIIDNSVTANVGQSTTGGYQTTLSANNVTVGAVDSSYIMNIAGQVNVSLDKNPAVGAAVTYNEIGNTTGATVNHATITAPTAVTVSGTNSSKIDSIAAAGALSTGGPAVTGSITVNLINNATQGEVLNGSVIDAGTGKTNHVTVSTDDTSTLQSLAGSVALSGGKAGAGGAFAYNEIGNTNTAMVDASTIQNVGILDLTATEGATINTLAVAASGGQNLALSGSVAVSQIGSESTSDDPNDTGHTTTAKLQGTTLTGNNAIITMKGSDTSKIHSWAGAIAGSGKVAFGGAVAVNNSYGVAGGEVSGSTLTGIDQLDVNGWNSSEIWTESVAGGGSAEGAFGGSATANTIKNRTLAEMTSSSISDTSADVTVNAQNTGTILAMSSGDGISGSAGVGLAVAVNRIGNETDAYVDGSTGANYNVRNLTVSSISGGTIMSGAVGIGGGGDVGVAGSTATNYIRSNTKAYITDGAVIVAQDNVGVIAQTDDKITNAAGSAGIGLSIAGVGLSVTVNVISGDTEAYISGSNTKVTALAQNSNDTLTVSDGKLTGSVDLAKGLDLDHFARTDLQGMREDQHVTGVAVNATATHSVENLVANVGGGLYAGVAGTTNTSVISGSTQAYIDAAAINSSGTGSSNQKISVIAGDYAYSNGFVGTMSGGAAGVGIGADTNVFSNSTQAYITNSTNINAMGAIVVDAESAQGASSLAVSGAGGVVGIVGTASTGVFDSTTEAYLRSDTVNTGSLTVNASHDSNFFTAVGGVTVGGAAISGSFAIVSDGSTNKAFIETTTVNTSGAIGVSADNTVNIDNWSVSGAGGGAAGVAGSVAVSLINDTTEAYVTGSNLGDLTNQANSLQVTAKDTVKLSNRAGSLGVGLSGWGVGAGASVIELGDTTAAYVSDSNVYVLGQVKVDSQAERTLSNIAVTVGIGQTAGISGSAAVTLVGQELTGTVNSQELNQSNNGTLTKVNNLTNSNRLSGGNVSGADGSAGLVGGVTSGMTSAEMDEVNNAGNFSTAGLLNPEKLSYRTTALVTGKSTLTAGSVQISAGEKDNNSIHTGGLAVGSVGIGGSVGVMDVNHNVEASVLGSTNGTPQIISTGSIGISATVANLTADNPGALVHSYQGSAGYVGLGAAVSVVDVTSNVTADVVRGTTLSSSGGGISVTVEDSSSLDSEAKGFSAGIAAAGIVSANAFKDGTVSASIGDLAASGNITSVSSGSGPLTVQSSRSGQVYASTLAGAGGVFAGDGSDAVAMEKGEVTALIGNQVTVNSTGAAKVEAVDVPQTYADQRGYGGGLLAHLGIGVAIASATPHVTAEIGSNSNITAGSLMVSAITRQNGANDSAYSHAEAVGIGGYFNLSINQSTAETESIVTAKIDNGTKVSSGSMTVSASNVTKQEAKVFGVAGGLVAAGGFKADANANSTTNATVGDGVYGDVGSTLTVSANGVDNTYAESTAGSGGLVAGNAAIANTHNGSSTTATLGGGTSAHPLIADNMQITAKHEADLNSKVDSINAAVLGASGAVANNYTYADDSNGSVGTVVTAQIAPNAYLDTYNIQGLASNTTKKPELANGARNANAGAGGLLNGAAAVSRTEVDDYTHFIIGSGATINVEGDWNNPLLTNFDAVNNLQMYDNSHLDTGGAITIAEAVSSLKAENVQADVTMKANSTINSVGPVNLGARSKADLDANAIAKTYGLAGAAEGDSTASINTTNTIHLETGATIHADGNVSLLAGRDSSGASNHLTSKAYTDLYNKTAFPIDTDPQADAIVNQTNNINIDSGASIGSVGDVNLITDKGVANASGQGIGKDLYREILAEIGSAISNLFGGGDVSLDIHGGTSTNNAHSTATVNGKVNAGIQHIQYLDVVDQGYSPDSSISVQPDQIEEQIKIQVGLDDQYNPVYKTYTVYRTPGVTYTLGTEDLQSNLVARITGLQNLLGSYSGVDQNTIAAIQAEISFLQAQLNAMYPGGKAPASNTQIKDVPLLIVDPVKAQSGNINIAADSLVGSGSIIAPGDVQIDIINNSQAFLRTNQLTIPENSGGYVYFNNVSVSSSSDVNSRNSSHSFDGTVTAMSTSAIPAITVQNTYVPSNDDVMAPDIEVVGNISNLRGSLVISSAAGSVNIQSADPKDPLTAPSIDAYSIKITSGQNFFYNNPNSWYNVGGSPRSQWGGSINSGGIADQDAKDYQKYVTDNSTTATSRTKTYTGVINGSDGINAGGNVFISARYLNINGTIQSGIDDYSVTLTSSQALMDEITNDQANYNNLMAMGNTSASPLYQLKNTSGNVTAFYNAATGNIELQKVRSAGGSIQLVGEILNTGGGKLTALDGYSHITVTNNTGYNIVENGLDTGGNGIAGKITITDFAQKYQVPNTSIYLPVTTTYTRKNGDIHVTKTASYYQVDGTITTYIIQGDTDTGSARGLSGQKAVQYNPVEGERYMWISGEQAVTLNEDHYFKVTHGWFFEWSTDNYDEHNSKSTTTDMTIIPQNGYEEFTGINTSIKDSAMVFVGETAKVSEQKWDTYESWSSGFLGYYKHHQWDHYNLVGNQIYNVYSVKADNPIGISFIGHDQGAVSMTSQAGIILSGSINNASGSVTLTAGKAITSTSSQAVITSPNISMSAQTGIGNGSGNSSVSFTLTGNPSGITATSTSGDINLYGTKGQVLVNQITTGGGGNVTLTADGNIVQAQNGNNAVITGHAISLVSKSGEIGTSSQSLNIQVVPTSSSDLNAGLSAVAADDIYLRQPNNDLPLISITSLGGNVTIEAANGTLVNANPNEKPDTRNQEAILQLWQENQLLSGQGAETSEQNTLKAYQNMMSQLYQDYWRNVLGVQMQDPTHYTTQVNPGNAPALSASEKAQLKQYQTMMGWSDGQMQAFEDQLVQTFCSGSYNAAYVYQVPTTGSNVILQSNLVSGYFWTEKQLQTGITSLYFKQTSDTQTVIPDPNVAAKNGNVTLKALNGSVGTDVTPIVIQGADLANPTDTQRLALAAAEAIDIQENNDPNHPSITVLQRRAINIDSPGAIDIQAQDHVYIGSQTDLRIKTAEADQSIRIKGQMGLYDVSTGGAAVQLTGSNAQGVILEAAKDAIGTAANPFTVALTSGTLTARADQAIYINAVTGDLSIASLYTPSTAYIEAAGSILDARDTGNSIAIQANGLTLIADTGHIGTSESPLAIAVGPKDDAALVAVASTSGEGIYLTSPARVGKVDFPSLNLQQVVAGGDIEITAGGNIDIKTITATAGNVNLTAQNSILNRSGNSDVNLASVNMELAAIKGQIGEADARLVIESTGIVNASADGDIHIEERNGNLVSDSMVSKTGLIDLLASNGDINVSHISAPQLSFNLPAVGSVLDLANIQVSESIIASADNVTFGNLTYTGNTPLHISINGGSKDVADNVNVTATSDVGIIFDKLHTRDAMINAQTINLRMESNIIKGRGEINNLYYSVLTENNYHGLEDFDLQLYPADNTFYLELGASKTINLAGAYVVNYDPEFVINEPAIRNSMVRHAELDLPYLAIGADGQINDDLTIATSHYVTYTIGQLGIETGITVENETIDNGEITLNN